LIPVLALGLLAGALGGCGGDDEVTTVTTTITTQVTTTAPATTTAETTTTATTTAATTTTPTTTQQQPQVETVRIEVVGGKPEGGIVRPTVERGQRVVLVIHSDTADEVHLHGYDISVDVAAGGTARLPFVADTPGRFEVELENLGVQLAEITVT
jgi:hypothetical protein